MKSLPVFLSIPHGGTGIPVEVSGRLKAGTHEIFEDGDPFAREIYDIGDVAAGTVSAEIARAFIDLNRSMYDIPPKNPDGVIKSTTFSQKPIYQEGAEPDEDLRRVLIKKHYMPYHRAIQRAVSSQDLQLCLDCHTMMPHAPAISPDESGRPRPMFCLSNRDGQTSSHEMISRLLECIAESFQISLDEISINDPFKGGYITQTYGMNPVPWIQVEINRDLYLSPQWFDTRSLCFKSPRLTELNSMFESALRLLLEG